MNISKSVELFQQAQEILPGALTRRYALSEPSAVNLSLLRRVREPIYRMWMATVISIMSFPGGR